MDKKDVLKEAKATINSIKSAQTTLDNYLRRLEHIVEKLEFEDLKREHLTLSDVENINEKIKAADEALESDIDHKKIVFKPDEIQADKTEEFDNKTGGRFAVYSLLVVGILLLTMSLFLTVKKVSPNYNFFNHYIYNYSETNMENDIPFNSLVVISKLNRQDLEVLDDVAYKQGIESVKIVRVVEVVDDKQDSYKTESISHIFDEPEVLMRSEVLGRIKYTIPVLGGIFSILVDNFWLVYLISGSILLIAYLLNKRQIN